MPYFLFAHYLTGAVLPSAIVAFCAFVYLQPTAMSWRLAWACAVALGVTASIAAATVMWQSVGGGGVVSLRPVLLGTLKVALPALAAGTGLALAMRRFRIPSAVGVVILVALVCLLHGFALPLSGAFLMFDMVSAVK